jgi:folate-binding protein YgfZ
MQNPLNELALFDVTGDDAASFLQGQLTQDVLAWQPNEIKRAAWCNVKGRMLASFYVWPIEGGFRFIVASDLAAKVLPRLRMFVMRAKVTVSDALAAPLYSYRGQGTAMRSEADVFTLLDSGFGLTTNAQLASSHDWLVSHIQAGVAWISAANSEQFVPQTANFELVGGVNFRKGCYPGQEIVARSQYLGKLKQRAAIALVAGNVNPLDDVFELNSPNPVGRVIQATGGWVLFDAPHALIDAGTHLHFGSQEGAILNVQPLPYAVTDITA